MNNQGVTAIFLPEYRVASPADIESMHEIRVAVRENILPDAGMITVKDYEEMISEKGRGWICEEADGVLGFSIADLSRQNVWAVFVRPGYEGRGIGRKLVSILLDWYFEQTEEAIWLGTAPNTRAEKLYREFGWKENGRRPNGEIRFEMDKEEWFRIKMLKTAE